MCKINSLIYYILLLSTFISARGDLHSNGSNVTSPTSNVSTQILAEGGALPQNSDDKTHLSREHVTVTENNSTKVNKTTSAKHLNVSQSDNNMSNKTDDSAIDNKKPKPVVEKLVENDTGELKDDGKQSVAKKGANWNDTVVNHTSSTTTTMTTSAPVVTKSKATTVSPKPKLTVRDDFVPNNSQSNKLESHSKFSNVDTSKSNRANYVIPIVAVILSVPLVAIIISVLYKRGQDWWQHRNYRRMDFLIEGMYNN